jgi:hypothetical protein
MQMSEVQIPTSGAVSVLYNGEQITTAITIEEVLIPRKTYTRVGTMGQLNGSLYLVDVDDEPDIDMQKYANLVKVEWVSKLFDVTKPDTLHTSGKERSLTHGEVVALYIQYERKSGAYTKAFTIPGTLPSGTDLNTITLPDGSAGYRFQSEDTIHNFNTLDKSGTPGVWYNLDETYPDVPSFNSSAVGGVNLRGANVRHFRMPSIAWCKTNLYSTTADYGRSLLDMLGLRFSNVIIPSAFAGDLTGRYVIHFARKTVTNMTVLGQSLLLYGAKATDGNYVSTGGNFNSGYALRQNNPGTLVITNEVIRFHAFDMLTNKPQVSPDYLQTELKHGITNIAYTPSIYFEDQTRTDDPARCSIMGYKMDYITDGNFPIVDRHQIKVLSRTYVPSNMVLDRFENTDLEGFIAIKADAAILTPVIGTSQNVAVHNVSTPQSDAVKKEDTYLTSAMVIRRNCYAPFTSQALVRMGIGMGTATFFNGDTFINDYTFHTYGWFAPNNAYNNSTGQRNTQGTRTIRRFVCECAANLWARYEDISNKYSFYYPKHTIKYQEKTNYITDFLSTEDPNQFAYSKDSNALNDLQSVTIWSPTTNDILTVHPYRVHRNGKMDTLSKKRSWRTSLALDFHELQKTMGKVTRIYGMDDRLIIMHENAMFLTQDKTKLESDILNITLGAGDIFQFEPQQKESAKLGYAGSQHPLACIHTPEGFVFIDAKAGRMYLWKGELQLMNNLLSNFFRLFLRMKESNVFNGNGYTIGYDQDYGRIMLTAKDVRLLDVVGNELTTYVNYQDTDAFLASLVPGQIVYKDGKYLEYTGTYNGTQPYDCPTLPIPVCVNRSASITNAVQGTVAYTLNLATYNATEFYITAGNDDGLFTLSHEGVLTFATKPTTNSSRVLTVKANNTGGTCSFSITLDWTTQILPTLRGFNATVTGGTAGSTLIGIVLSDTVATSFVITTVGSPFTVVQVDDYHAEIRASSTLPYSAITYDLGVTATTVNGPASAPVRVVVTAVNQAPIGTDQAVYIWDTTPTGTTVAYSDISDPNLDTLTLLVVAESNPGMLQITSVGDINIVGTPVAGQQYTIKVRATDPAGLFKEVLYVVNILHDPRTIKFRPISVLCGATCPTGYSPTPDGSSCIKITTLPADPPTGPSSVAARMRYVPYGISGMIVYRLGEFNANGTPIHGMGVSFEAITDVANHFWVADNTTNYYGRLNAVGVWRKTSCSDPAFWDSTWTMIGFSRTFTLSAAKTVYIGMGADNVAMVKLNGTLFIQQPGAIVPPVIGDGTLEMQNHFYWNIYPVTLAAGTHIIEMTALNQGSVACMGVEVYDNTEAEILAATSEADLNILFSTKNMDCQAFDLGDGIAYSCTTAGTDFALDTTTAPPTCKKVEYVAPLSSAGTATIGFIQVQKLDGTPIATYPNDGAQHYFEQTPVPIMTPLANSTLCAGAIPIFYNAMHQSSVRKNDCVTGTGSDVIYVVPDGTFSSTLAQSVADDLAANDIALNSQSYANTHGICQ